MFSESDVLEACAELDCADVSGWNFFVESHGVKVYQQYNKVCKFSWINYLSASVS